MKTRFLAVMASAVLLVSLMSLSACRPHDTTHNGEDTTTVIDEFFTDTISGVWEDDTISTTTDMLLVHQENLEDIFFQYDSDELSSEALDVLMSNASYIMETEGYRILIEGHCDERGTIDYNLALGEKRSVSAYDYLVNYGVDSGRLEYVSYGKERPFDPGHNEQAWARNRRAHFRVLPGN